MDDLGACDFMRLIRDRSKGTYYRWLEPESQTEFADAFDLEVIPVLNSVVTLEDYARRANFPDNTRRSSIKITRWYPLGIALGRFDWVHENLGVIESGAALAELPDVPQRAQARAHFRRVMEFVPLVRADDRAGMIALLHELLRDDVRRFDLESYWTPEPFPIETMA